MRLSMLSAGASLLLLAGCGGGETPEPEPKADVVASDDGIDTRIGGEEGSGAPRARARPNSGGAGRRTTTAARRAGNMAST